MTKNRSVFLGVLAVITLILAGCGGDTTIDNTGDDGKTTGTQTDTSVAIPSVNASTSQAQFTADMLATMEKLYAQAENIMERYYARINTSAGADNSPTGNFSRSVTTVASSIRNQHNVATQQQEQKTDTPNAQTGRNIIENGINYIYEKIGSYLDPHHKTGVAVASGPVYEQYVNEIVPAYRLARALATRNVMSNEERSNLIAEVTPLLNSLRSAGVGIPSGDNYSAIASSLQTVIRGKVPSVMGTPAQDLFKMLFDNGDWCNYIDDAKEAGLSTLMVQW